MLQAEFASLTPRRVLLCTVGECKAGTTARLPPDGLCDLLFYTALHLRPLTNGSQAITAHKTNWRPFRREAAAAKRTRYGVSFPLRNIEQMTRYLASKKSRRQIQSLFKAHIEHFGVLNFTVDSEDYAHDKKIGKRLFQHCKQDYVRELAAPGKIRIASYKNYSVSFEDSEIMKQKAADFFEIYRHEKQGWALFDVDFDDFNDTCGEGAFHRISEFKSFLAQAEPVVQV
ncbi:hypothetical protein MRX96_041803 [Rhipicephalus microplus]